MLKDHIVKAVTTMHRTIYDLSGGKLLNSGAGMPVLKLTTIGRKSGKRRTTMLTPPLQRGDTIILAASYGGDDRHPAWFLNLRDNPEVEVEMEGKTIQMTARVTEGDERTKLWDEVAATHLNYMGYQTKTGRLIPVIELTPRVSEA